MISLRRTSWGLVSSGILLIGCAGVLRAEAPAVSTDGTAVAASTATAEPAYIYKGDRMRDPFVPLTGQGSGAMDSAAPKTDLGPFNPTGAELKGILKTPTGRWALLRTTDGVTYVVQNGRIHDPKRKPIEGFQGIVKEKSVVILAPGNQEFELKLKKDKDEDAGRKP